MVVVSGYFYVQHPQPSLKKFDSQKERKKDNVRRAVAELLEANLNSLVVKHAENLSADDVIHAISKAFFDKVAEFYLARNDGMSKPSPAIEHLVESFAEMHDNLTRGSDDIDA